MRPSAGGDALAGRPRKSSLTDMTTPLAGPGHGTQTTFFLANEDMMERSVSESDKGGKDSSYGVRSLEETVDADGDDQEEEDEDEDEEGEGDDEGDLGGHRRSTLRGNPLRRRVNVSATSEHESISNSAVLNSNSRPRRPSPTEASQPLTPLSLESPAPGSSLPSSPKSSSTRSFRHSDEDSVADDNGSQAVVSSGDEDGDSPPEIQDSAPQLIMPSIRMPSRRPFTERGKNMDRLKVLIAGDSGVGKTSLIKSIVQLCEDIVHVDPLSSSPPTLALPQTKKSSSRSQHTGSAGIKQITEVYASTKPYPSWWSDFEESKILRRRKSMGDTVLERNLCFVDTPGYSGGMSLIEGVEPIIRYVEAQIARTMSTAQMTDPDLLSLLTGNGGPQVDVVLYLVSQKLKPIDLEFLRRLSALTNVIPLIAKADLHAGNVSSLKTSIAGDLHSASIRPFNFSKTDTTSPTARMSSPPYAVSSLPSNDTENMDASLLMSPDYVQPLIPTELAFLVDQLFEGDTIAWLRHSAAMKCLQWRKGASSNSTTVPDPRSPLVGMTPFYTRIGASTFSSSSMSSSSTTSQALISYNNTTTNNSHGAASSSYTLARIADHTQREEKLAQVRLAKWAGELRRSLQNERDRYEALARGERAGWLRDRLGEVVPVTVEGGTGEAGAGAGAVAVARQPCGNNGRNETAGVLSLSKIPTSSTLSSSPQNAPTTTTTPPSLPLVNFNINPHDPLGLLQWNEAFRSKGWVAVQVVGSFGVIGALAVWLARNWDWGCGWNWGEWWWGGGE